MARNCEKHFVGLNRVFLEEQWDREKERKRPPLHKLNSASEVKKWIPSIKREMNYCLQQLSGVRKHDYSEAKFKEFEDRVQFLEREYKRFVKRVFELDPSATDVPWEARAYKKKRKMTGNDGACCMIPTKQKTIQICPALLDGQTRVSDASGDENSDDESRKTITKRTRDKSPDLENKSKANEKVENSPEIEKEDETRLSETVLNRASRFGSLVEYDSSDSENTCI